MDSASAFNPQILAALGMTQSVNSGKSLNSSNA
jgi:hypothetical protein